MYTAGLTAVYGFPPRLPDININTCRRDGLPARRRGAIRNDRDDDDDDDPFSAYNNRPSPPLPDDTPVGIFFRSF